MRRPFSWKQSGSKVADAGLRPCQPYVLSAVVFLTYTLIPFTCRGQFEQSHEAQLAEARIEFNIAQENVEKAKPLFERGSLSERRFHEFQVELDLATLKLTMLKEPDRKDEIELLIAKVKADSAKKIREDLEKLFQNGSISRLELDRAIYVHETSELLVRYLQCDGDRERNFIRFKLAAKKFQLATSVFEIHQRLYERGSISQIEFESSKTRLELAEIELAEQRKAMGATARILGDQ